MKKILFFYFWIISVLSVRAQAQTRIVTGILTDDNKEPLVGVSITIKGTSTGTTSDVRGRYKLYAPLGATLVFSFIGMQPREMVVTEKNSRPSPVQIPDPAPVAQNAAPSQTPAASDTSTTSRSASPSVDSAPAVAVLQDGTPGFAVAGQMPLSAPYSKRRRWLTYPLQLPNAYSIRYVSGWWARLRYGEAAQNGVYIVDTQPRQSLPLQLTFHTTCTIDQVNRLPALQDQYAQGRPQKGTETWQGTETGEYFSWGPKVNNLEYSGLPYIYDANGTLVPRGTGTGIAARTYQPYAFFRNGYSLENSLHIKTHVGKTEVYTGFSHYTQQAVLPQSKLSRTQGNLQLERVVGQYLTLKGAIFYTHIHQHLPDRSGNWTRLMASVMLTPPTFDNAYNRGRAYATDNPYTLAAQLSDAECTQKLLSSFSVSYKRNHLAFLLKGHREQNQQHTVFGLPPTVTAVAQSRLTERHQNHSFSQLAVTPSYDRYGGNLEFHAEASYRLGYQQERLYRQDGFGFAAEQPFQLTHADSVYTRQATVDRLTHEVSASIQLNYRRLLILNAANHTYSSSTISQNMLGLPAVGLAFPFSELYFLQYSSFLTRGKLYTNFSRQAREAPLVYTQWAYNSTVLSSTDFRKYTENQEIVSPKSVQPERIQKWEAGLDVLLFRGHLAVSVTHFRNLTQQALVPVVQNGVFRLDNLADIRNRGIESSITFKNQNSFNALHITTQLTFSSARPVVTHVYGTEKRLPMAGFADVSTNLIAGQPYGVIVGSRWKRTEGGQLVIGADGYPLVDAQPGIIGNPNPRWTAGLENTLKWRNWQLLCVWDFRRGGDVWNGTQQVLDYYGVSQRTQEQRETRQYIFEGVQENGQRNSIPVDFAHPVQGLEGNRWVRYGVTGVAEEAIQDASWIRLNELKISYSLSRLTQKWLDKSQLTVALIGKNLWVHTPYTGVDPAAALWGYSSATGLDLFNAPSVRSYGASLHVVF